VVISREVAAVLPPGQGAEVTISVPGGEEVAAKTFNPRLGIVGGISILGTTGIVRPMSEEAYRDGLACAVDVAAAEGHRRLVLTPGRTGERLAVERYGFSPSAVVQMGNFAGFILERAAAAGIKEVLLWGHHGKLVKLAGGIFHTHSRVADGRLEILAALAAAEGAAPALVESLLGLAAAEEAVPLLQEAGLGRVFCAVAERASQRGAARVQGRLKVGTVLLDRSGAILGLDKAAREIAAALGVALPEPERGLAPGLYVVGMGPGDPAYLTPAAWRYIRLAKVLVGGKRILSVLKPPPEIETYRVTRDYRPLLQVIASRCREVPVAVLVSGDPGLFSFLGTLRRERPDLPVTVVPGISAAALAFARLGMGYEDAVFISLHGREAGERVLVAAVKESPKAVVLTSPQYPPQAVGRFLAAQGMGERTVYVFSNLSLPAEKSFTGPAAELAAAEEDFPNAVVVVLG
jgi:precorrin-6y C5,15-methyltransferase (decarboxylating) CbiE subunit